MAAYEESIVVDHNVCQVVADILVDAGIPEDHEDVIPPLPHDRLGNFYLSLVAICHQTQTLRGGISGVPARGWDYLQARWAESATRREELLTPEVWASISPERLEQTFEDSDAGRTLSATVGRANLLNQLGSTMLQNGWNSLIELHEISGGRIATGEPNLVALLAKFRAYEDPVRKKTFFLLGLMRKSAGWSFADPDELGAPVDYHEVRGHLRLGTVQVRDPRLSKKLLDQAPVDKTEDLLLRTCVAEAIRVIAGLSGVRDCMRLHYLFWNLFRSICLRADPYCHKAPTNVGLPARYVHFIARENGGRCPFCLVCNSADTRERYLEHSFETDWY